MWWSRAGRISLLLLPLFLAACGFRPLYGDGAGGAGTSPVPELASIFVDTIPDRPGQLLRNRLMTGLTPRGEPEAPRYRLSVRLREDTETYLARRDETATRADIKIWADYTLYERRSDGKDVALNEGQVRQVVGYNLPHEEYSSVVNERAARETALDHVATEISRRLANYFRRRTEPDNP